MRESGGDFGMNWKILMKHIQNMSAFNQKNYQNESYVKDIKQRKEKVKKLDYESKASCNVKIIQKITSGGQERK